MTTTGQPMNSWWHREPEPFKRQFITGNDMSVEHFLEERERVLSELRSIVDVELCHVRAGHLVRLRVEIQLCY
jgi:hypothetical protein